MTTKLAELERLNAARTKGPWWSDSITVTQDTHYGISQSDEKHIASVENSHVTIAECSSGLFDAEMKEVNANADFIAAMANSADALIKVVRAADKAIKCELHDGAAFHEAMKDLGDKLAELEKPE